MSNGAHAGRDVDRHLLVDVVREQDCELVAAESRDGLDRLEGDPQPPPDLAEKPVADVVAERVVQLLETVEVDQEQGHARLPANRLAEPLVEPTEEVPPVPEPGEVVRLGKPP